MTDPARHEVTDAVRRLVREERPGEAAVARGAREDLPGRPARHVEIGRNRVEDAYGACRSQLSGEVRELADRGMAVWTQVDGTLYVIPQRNTLA